MSDFHTRFRLRELLHDIQHGMRFHRPRISDGEQAVELLRQLGMNADADRLEKGCQAVAGGLKPDADFIDFVQGLHRCFELATKATESGTPDDQGPADTAKPGKQVAKDGRTPEERNRAVASYLEKHATREIEISYRDIATAIGSTPSAVQRTPAWTKYNAKWTAMHGRCRTAVGTGRRPVATGRDYSEIDSLVEVGAEKTELDLLVTEQAIDEACNKVYQQV